jgi:hypothetical protein
VEDIATRKWAVLQAIAAQAAEQQRQDALPWAAAVIAHSWKRYVLRKRLRKWISIRRRSRAIFMRPYWHMWHIYASVRRRSAMARKRSVLRAWHDYCDDMETHYKAVIMWTARFMHNWRDVHLTWALCPAQSFSSPPEQLATQRQERGPVVVLRLPRVVNFKGCFCIKSIVIVCGAESNGKGSRGCM